jgi:hypothetical protein
MELHQIRIQRSVFDSVPADERTLLVLLAHVANELNVLVRLFHWSAASSDRSPIEERGNNVLVFTVIRLFTGKLYEAWKLLRKAFFASKLAKAYESELETTEQASLQYLKQYFGKQNAIKRVRNGYAFHYSPEQIKASYSAVPDAEELDMYLGESALNSLYYFADAIANRALLHEINPKDHQAAMEQLRVETTQVHSAFHNAIAALVAVAVKRHLRKTLEELGATEVEISPLLDSEQISIPFFVNVAAEGTQPAVPADAAASRQRS